ncbi:MAG: hypothetical protein QM607_08115 [Microbacterium sp.]
MKRAIEALGKPYTFIALSAAGVACFGAVDVVYFETVGYSLAFIGVLTAAFNFAVSAAELPFAVVFDRYSNKGALQIGNAVRIMAFLLFFLNLSSGTLIAAEILAGIAVAAMSGTSTALVVNEIEHLDANKATTAFARISYVSAGAAVVGGGAGLALFVFRPQWIWLGAAMFFVLAGIVVATFPDTRAHIERMPWRQFGREVVVSLRSTRAVVMVLANAAAVAPAVLWQLKFNQVSILFIFAGFLGMQIANLLGPLLLERFHLRAGSLPVIAVLNVIVAIFFALVQHPAAVWTAFAIHVLLHGMMLIVIGGVYHARVPNSVRATAGSVISMADSLVVAVCAPIITIIGQNFGLPSAIALSGALYLAIGGLALTPGVRRAETMA